MTFQRWSPKAVELYTSLTTTNVEYRAWLDKYVTTDI